MIDKIKEIIEKCSTLDIDGNIKYVDKLDYDKLANELLPAINFTRCCTEVCEDETHETKGKLEDVYRCECDKLKIY